MGISTSQLYLILRARDEASRVLSAFGANTVKMGILQQNVINASGKAQKDAARAAITAEQQKQALAKKQMAIGSGLATMGVAVAAGGILALNALNKMVDSAVNYNNQTNLTLTQVDKANVSFKQLWTMGLNIGKTVPVAFDDIQKSLYDIFSSITTDGPGAQKILDAIARAAVGGQTSMENAGRAIIAVLNAYKLPASAAVKVSDVLFQLVRKGVGTYAQFTEVIGRAIPSALKAGQSIQDLAGMMAFLTRNGLSAANAAASSARALDALSKPTAIANLKKIGVQVSDTTGHFRPMVDIMADLSAKLKGLTPVARAAKLNEIFKGAGGTIQAMRFFNLGVSDSTGLLKEMTTDMHNAGGAAAQAYNIMSNTPAAKVQLLNNKYTAMKITIGNQLIPIKLKLVSVLTQLLGMWEKLSPKTQHIIVMMTLVASVAAVFIGVVLAIAGAFLIMAGAAAAADLALLPVIGIVAAVVAGLIALGVAVFFIIKYWAQIKKFTVDTWNSVYGAIRHAWDNAWHFTVKALNDIRDFVVRIWDDIFNAISHSIGNSVNAVAKGWDAVIHGTVTAWRSTINFITGTWNSIATFAKRIWGDIAGFIEHVVWEVTQWIEHHWGMLLFFILTLGLGLIARTIILHWQGIHDFTIMIWTAILDFFKAVWNSITSAFFAAVDSVVKAMEAMYNAVINGGKAIFAWFMALPGRVKAIFVSSINWLGQAGRNIITGLWNGLRAVWNSVVSFLTSAYQTIIRWGTNSINWLNSAGRNTMSGFWNGLKAIWNSAYGWLLDVFTTILRWGSNALKWLPGAGEDVINGLWQGMKKAWDSVVKWFKDLPKKILGYLGIASPPKWSISAGEWMMKGILKGIVNHAGGAAAFMTRWASSTAKKVGGTLANAVSIGGPGVGAVLSGAGGLAGWIESAIAATGVGQDWFAPLYRRVMFESGGNPNAINLTDANAAAGHPSMGLMQTIASTFAAYAAAGHGNVWNPVDNLIAAIGYIKSRYGSITAIDPPVQGYRSGAWNVLKDQLAMIHKNEMVVPSDIAAMIRSGGKGGGGDKYFDQKFYVSTQEIDPRKHAADLGWELAVQAG